MTPEQLASVERDYQTLINSFEYAYAMGHGCSMASGQVTYFDEIRNRARDLRALIQEHKHQPA
jgi:hypothetical protein